MFRIRVGVVKERRGEEVEREKDAVDEELIGGEEIGLRARRVSPKLELGGVGIGAGSPSSAAAL